jgi:hypothetical protein
MKELYELECIKCGNRSFSNQFEPNCKRIKKNFDKKTICNGKNRVKSVGLVT